MMRTLLLSFFLRCPNCEQGQIAAGMFNLRETCPVCRVRFERKSGESTGGSIILISVLPILALVVFFVLYAIDSSLPMALLLGVPLLVVVAGAVLLYRNVRALWVGVTYLTEGLYTDDEKPLEIMSEKR